MRLCLLAVGLLLSLAIGEWWSRVGTDGAFREQYFSADLLVWPTVIEDVVVRGHPFARSWHLTQAPYFVPDALLALGTRAALTTVEGRQYANIVAQILLLALALSGLAHTIARGLAPLGPAIVAIFVILAVQGREPFAFTLYPSYHLGVAILGATSLMLLIGGGSSRLRLVTLTVLLALGTASDPLLAVFWSGGVPLAVLGVATRVGGDGVFSRVLRPGLFGGAGCAVGCVLSRFIPFPDRSQAFSGLTTIGETIRTALSHWSNFDGAFRAMLVVGTACLAFVAFRAKDPSRRTAALFLLGGTIATLTLVVVSGKLAEGGWNRYLVWPTLSACLGIYLVPSTPVVARWASALATAAIVAHGASPSLWRISLNPPPSQLRAEVDCLDELARLESAAGLIAGYWQAKPIALFSREGLSPAQFTPALDAPSLWITSRSWYWPKRDFAFVVTNGLNDADIDRELGPIYVSHQCGTLSVRIYRGTEREFLSRFVENRARQAMGAP